MAKRKRRGRKGSRKHAMPRKVKSRRGRRGKRHSNPGAMASVVLGGLGYLVAGGLGHLVNSNAGIAAANQQWVAIGVSAVGAGVTAMISSEYTPSLAAGMAANAGLNLLRKGSDAAKLGTDAKKFMGLSQSTAALPSGAMPDAGTASSAVVFPALVSVWDTSSMQFKDSAGAVIQGAGVAGSRTIKDAAGNTGTLELFGVVKDGKTYILVAGDGNVWVRDSGGSVDSMPAASLSLSLAAPVTSLAGTFPPWAGYPGYDKRSFPQQVVSLPAQYAPQVHGYANFAPTVSGYANFAPSMSGWDAGYGHM